MAASDPTPYVATPTGTLQGVAAFSWDGSAWQPTGRAGPSVATPTGVLRGVAAFNGGPSWQPSGRAQPGVATPTGVLDGVAVYTWTGNAWVPPGGTETPSTPSGVLRGVAAFNWDGAAWQPAGQAGPSVATPYGVLDGVAMFNWTGSVWGAAGATSLSLDFTTPGALDPRITFTRASTATYFDATGTLQTATTNAPRWDYDPVTHVLRGLLIEEARTNLLLNSATLGTQGVAVTAQAYTLSFYGTGTVTMSGAFAGSLVGTGASPARVQTTFTPAAGTLTCTVTGSVLNAQLEAGAFVTSWIPTTAAAVTRAVDGCSMPIAAWYNVTTSTLAAEAMFTTASNAQTVVDIDNGTTAQFARLYRQPGTNTLDGQIIAVSNYDAVIGGFAALVPTKAAMAYQNGSQSAAISGTVIGAWGTATPQPTGASVLQIGGLPGLSQILNGYIRRVQYWPRVLSNAELQAVTT